MKIAILNLSNNIAKPSTVSSYETIAYAEMLRSMGSEVTIISRTVSNYTIAFNQVHDINEYDRLIVVNGAINFFGGVENPVIIENYKLMAKYKSTIYYLFTDFRLAFKQLWPAIEKRGWGHTREDVWVDAPFVILSQGRDLAKTGAAHAKSDMNIQKIVYSPLERYKVESPEIDELIQPMIEAPDSQLIYGGSFRSGKRLKDLTEYFFNTSYDAELFGTIKFKQFKLPETGSEPTFTGKVKPQEMITKLSTGVCTLILGDAEYLDNFVTLRVWEAAMSGSVVLIDEKFDPKHLIFPDEVDRFRYVNTSDDVAELLEHIRVTPGLRKVLVDRQHHQMYEAHNEKQLHQSLNDIIIGGKV